MTPSTPDGLSRLKGIITGEPDDRKRSRPVRWEAVGKGPKPRAPRQRPTQPEGIKPCKIEAARNSGDFGQVPSSTGPQCTGARVGGPVRAKILWLPAGPQLPGRNRRYLCVVSRAPGSAAVGS